MDLYSKDILKLSNEPSHFLQRDDADYVVKAYNTFCGDKFKIQLDYQGKVSRADFHGYGCAVSKASAEILSDVILQKNWKEISEVCNEVVSFLSGEKEAIDDVDERLNAFSVVKKYPGRFDCAALCWKEVGDYALGLTRTSRE